MINDVGMHGVKECLNLLFIILIGIAHCGQYVLGTAYETQ